MKTVERFLPIVTWVRGYKKAFLNGDLSAGITVGIMLIPQGMAYAMIAGLPPVYGLYASIVPQLIYAILGTSRQLSVAPVAMDSLLVAAGVSVLATEGSGAYIGFAILLAFFMGLFQLLLGVFRMGFITNLLSKPVISGFTSAAALIIGLNQLKYLTGTDINKSNNVFDILWNTLQKLEEIHLLTFFIGIAGIIIIKSTAKIHKRISGSLVAVVLGTTLVYLLQLDGYGVSIVGTIPDGLPSFQLPDFHSEKIGKLVPLALTISIVAFMEAYSVAKAIEAKKRDYKVVANQELIGLGAANLIGSLFQAYPVTGGFSRSAVNYQTGAHTPLASVVSAAVISLTLLFLTPLFYYLPEAMLASVIMVAVSGLVDAAYCRQLWRENKTEFVVLLATFSVTLYFGMVPGIATGVLFSILLLLYKSAYPHIAKLGRLKGHTEFRNVKRFTDLDLWENKLIIRVDAPLTFINIQYVKEYIEEAIEENPYIEKIIWDASALSYIDASATQGLKDLLRALKAKRIRLIFANLVGPVRDALFRTKLLHEIGTENIYLTVNSVLDKEKHGDQHTGAEAALQHGEIDRA